MRSSKSRSRNKSNRQRSIGNIVNRVFDSSGPEGKVRGTPQQIIDKYLMLARDAQLGNDRVAEQNFLQHAEHYTRMLGEAQVELAREQAERQAQGGFGGGNGQPQQGWQDRPQGQQQHPRDRGDQRGHEPRAEQDRSPAYESAAPELPAFLTGALGEEGSDLVETPETRGQPERPQRRDQRDSRGEGRRGEARGSEARGDDARGGEGRGSEGRAGEGRAGEGRAGEGRGDAEGGRRERRRDRSEPADTAADRPRQPAPVADSAPATAPTEPATAPDPAPKPARAARRPRKPRTDDGTAPADPAPSED